MKRLILFLFVFWTIFGQQRVISKISISSVEDLNLREEINKSITINVGDSLDPEIVNENFKKILALGQVENVDLQFKELAKNQVEIDFVITLAKNIQKILFIGNKQLSSEELKSLLVIKVGEPWDYNFIIDSKEELFDEYLDQGFFDVKINIQRKIVDKQLHVHINIDEGERFYLNKIEFSGNKYFEYKKLRDLLVIDRSLLQKLFYSGTYVDKLDIERQLAKIKRLYVLHGFFDMNLNHSFNREEDKLVIKINEGTRYKQKKLEIVGNKIFKKEINKISNTLIKPFKQESIDKILEKIRNQYYKLGYVDLVIKQTNDIDSKNKKLRVLLEIREFQAYRIGNINIRGNDITKDSIIRRELTFFPGDLINNRQLEISQRRLNNLRYFSSVQINTFPTKFSGIRDIEIKLKEEPTGQISFSVGFSDDDSNAFFSLNYKQSNFDYSAGAWPFTGGGQSLNLQATFSNSRNNVDVRFVEPWLFNKRQRLVSSIFRRERLFSDYRQTNKGVGLALVNRLEKNKRWRFTRGLTLQTATIDDFSTTNKRLLDQAIDETWINSLNMSLTYDTRNAPRFPTKGSLFSTGFDLRTKILGSQIELIKPRISYQKYWLLFPKWVLKFSLEARISYSLKGNNTDIPIFDRYFAGGRTTIRGVDFRDVSPVDDNGTHGTTDDDIEIGGNSLFVSHLELLRNLGAFSVFTFIDVGNVWEEYDGIFYFDGMSLSTGVGLFLNLGPLPIKLSYGIVLDRGDHIEEENAGRLHFTLGTDF